MLGDPGTAKSQLLKFVEKCSPIGVGGLRCPLIVWLFFSFCSLYSTKDQTVVIADTNLPVHPWLDKLAELQTTISGACLEEMGCRTGEKGEKGKQVVPFIVR